jgi:arylsulfatase
MPYFLGEEEKGPRKEFFYFTDDGSVSALRYNDWKVMFTIQRAHGADVWAEPYVPLRLPMIQNIRQDPFERAHHEAMLYDKWAFERLFVLVPAQVIVGDFLATFQEFPPRQKPGSFSLDRVLEELQEGQPK